MNKESSIKIESEKDKKYFYEILDDVKEKVSSLSIPSFLKSAFERKNIIEKANKFITASDVKDLTWGNWPPLLLFVNRHSMSDIIALEDDIALTVQHSKPKAVKFLEADSDDRAWSGGVFEIFVKARLLRKFEDARLDFDLENGKNVDLRITNGGSNYSLECTVLTDNDEDKLVWKKFMDDKKGDGSAVLVRPGKYDSEKSKSPSLYYDCLRFYAKVYDKIALNLNLESSQLLKSTRNVLAISIDAVIGTLQDSLGIGWALDELFADQPRGSFSPNGITNVSLQAWVEFTAKELIKKGKLSKKTYADSYTEIVQAPKVIGGILLFNRNKLVGARVNYNAHKSCKLSHQEISLFEDLLREPPIWKNA
jgi:hypothetical protein